MTCPRPPQVGQLIAREPGSAPEPWHFSQLSNFRISISFFHTEGRFFERDLHVVTQIGPALAPFAIGGRAAAKKRFENSAGAAGAAEYFTENIERIVKTAATRPARTPHDQSDRRPRAYPDP